MGFALFAMLTFEEASERVLGLALPCGSERVTLSAAVGRVLAEDIFAPRSLPPAPTSAMDGYALACRELSQAAAPFRLALQGESRAGAPLRTLTPGSAARIFTGALLPAGADCVVIQENVVICGTEIRFDVLPRPGDNVRQTGEDLMQGALLLSRGTRLSAFAPGLLAAVERTELLVSARPRVAILCTGDELRRPDEARTANDDSRIPESNGVALAALVRAVGGIPELLPPVGDEPRVIASALEPALERCDVVFTVGGVSVGDHDHVREALTLAGAQVDFWKVKIKPGKPLTVATRGRCRVLGLPGNPVSAQVTFCLFGAPLLRRMQGDSTPRPTLRHATLSAPLTQKPGRMGFYRVRVTGDHATPLDNQSSGSAVSLALADALALIPAESSGANAGDRVELLWLSEI